ncbi:twin-arginine translocation signal domain-containing protein, partial [Sulfurovum sp.]
MDINRRDFLQIAAALGLLGATGGTNLFAGEAGKERIKKL